jgi:hypothetical protein
MLILFSSIKKMKNPNYRDVLVMPAGIFNHYIICTCAECSPSEPFLFCVKCERGRILYAGLVSPKKYSEPVISITPDDCCAVFRPE